MRRSCCSRAIGRSVPSSESSTRSRCCRSPKTICEVRVTPPFSFSLCCTRSDRRIVRLLQPNLFPSSPIGRTTSRKPHGLHHQDWVNRLQMASADYVPCAVCGKVWCALCVPDVQPSAAAGESLQTNKDCNQ